MSPSTPEFVSAVARDGYCIIPDVIGTAEVSRLTESVQRVSQPLSVRERNSRTYAIRNLLALVPQVRELACSRAVLGLVEPLLGPRARVVRGLLFDKTPDANWKVGWHQDLSIAVRQRVDLPGFGPWSVKADVTHVQPPISVLENMLTVRLHLDECGPESGPLNVLPGSHAQGVLDPAAVDRWSARRRVGCHVPAGGALLMRPLLLHASSSATRPGHRRVIHLEYAAAQLPPELDWHES